MIAELRDRNRAAANPGFPRIKLCQDNGHRGTGRSPVRVALNRANHSFPLDTSSMQILLGPAKLPDIGPLFATTNAKLPRCIVILLRHSLAQKNLQASAGQ